MAFLLQSRVQAVRASLHKQWSSVSTAASPYTASATTYLPRDVSLSLAIKAVVALVLCWQVAWLSRSAIAPSFSQHQSAASEKVPLTAGSPNVPSPEVTVVVEQDYPPHIGYFMKSKLEKYTDRVAVLIEDRPLAIIPTLMNHFQSVIGPRWPMILYTRAYTAEVLMESGVFRRAVEAHEIEVRTLPGGVALHSEPEFSLFYSSPWLWEDLAPYEKIFMFQTDTILCGASNHTIDEFLKYDMIGAPIHHNFGDGFDGALSIRNRQMALELFKTFSFKNESSAKGAPTKLKHEDQWLHAKMRDLPKKEDGSPGAVLPTYKQALVFSVQHIWGKKPFGFHPPQNLDEEKYAEMLRYCPEVKLIRD